MDVRTYYLSFGLVYLTQVLAVAVPTEVIVEVSQGEGSSAGFLLCFGYYLDVFKLFDSIKGVLDVLAVEG